MAIDPAYGNSSGYFKDPISGEDLTVDTPRVVPCSFENGKFTWPCVMRSDGEQLLKIVYKCFTEEEKELYKAYRGRSSGSTPRERKPRSPSGKTEKPKEEPKEMIIQKYSEESATSLKTLQELASCDRLYGVSNICGIQYVLCGSYNSNVVHHIPRSCVPDDEFERLCDGADY